MTPTTQLGAIRASIATLDQELLRLLKARSELSRKIGVIKNDHNLPVRDEAQEQQIYAQLRAAAEGCGLEPSYVEAIYRTIIAESVRVQEALRSASERP